MARDVKYMQLTLPVSLRDEATFQNFYPGDNQQLCQYLQAHSYLSQERFCYWWGTPGSGCTHLLQACCHAFSEIHSSVVYLDLGDHADLSPDFLMNLEKLALIALDNLDAIVGKAPWEEALFYLYNRVRDSEKTCLFVVANVPARQLNVLPDLKSRLVWGLNFQLHELTDEQKIAALQLRALNRGFPLSNEVAQYLLRHQSRDMHVLFSTLKKLDRASLSAKRKLTIPFVKNILLQE